MIDPRPERDATPTKIKTTVVVVEDDPASADVLQRRLVANGMEVSLGIDGATGLALVRRLRPDLVLLDVGLPDTDGYDVCLRIKSDAATADIPVIFLSARGDVFDKVRGLSCGAADYLTKPFHPAELLARVEAVLVQARRGKRIELERGDEPRTTGRATVVVAIRDDERRARAEALLREHFQLASAGDGARAELVLIDAGAPLPAGVDPNDEPAVLRVVAESEATPQKTGVITVDDDLVRIADLAVRERRLEQDVRVAAEALVLLATAVEAHDRLMAGHSERVAARAVGIAQVLGLDDMMTETIRVGALLRDIGNAKLPPTLARKAGELDPNERGLLTQHTVLGEGVLAGFRPLAPILPIVRWHHEHLDGSGYPDGLKAGAIPLEVRIVTVADRFEALLVDRPDRPALPAKEAVALLRESVAKGELDPAVVAALATTTQGETGGITR